MKKKLMIIAVGGCLVGLAAQAQDRQDSGTFSTPAFNGTGARITNSFRFRTNSNTALGTTLGTNTVGLGQPNAGIGEQGTGTAITPSGTTTAVTPQGTGTAVGQTGTALGQQGSGTAIGQQGTGTAIGQQGTGTAITPNSGSVVDSDGKVTTINPQGGSLGTGLGGTNVGTSRFFNTNNLSGQTNQVNPTP
jgi:hypothetical protein